MKKSLHDAILGIAFLLLAVTSSCAFKKNPNADKGGAIVVERAEAKALPTIEELISSEDEDKVIELLTERKDEVQRLAESSQVNPMDLAIKYEKPNILSYLLVLGHSPFGISSKSYEKLSSNATWSSLIASAQEDAFLDILRHYPQRLSDVVPSDSSFELFRELIDRYRLGSKGCERFSDYLMDLGYLQEKPSLPGAYYEVFERVNTKKVFRDLLSQSSCSKEVAGFSISLVAKWISLEIYEQLNSSFSSSDFLSFLVSLKKTPHVDLAVAPVRSHSSRASYRPQVAKVSPLSFLMLKKPCLDVAEFRMWFEIVKQISQFDKESYAYAYKLPTDATDAECVGDREYCYQNYENLRNLHTVFEYMYPGYSISDTEFIRLFRDRTSDEIRLYKQQGDIKKRLTADEFFREYCSDMNQERSL